MLSNIILWSFLILLCAKAFGFAAYGWITVFYPFILVFGVLFVIVLFLTSAELMLNFFSFIKQKVIFIFRKLKILGECDE